VTSSLRLRRVPSPGEHLDGICQAFVNVAESSYASFVQACDATMLRDALALLGDEDRWLHAAVDFRGAFGGTFQMALPESLARELVATCIGLDPQEQVEDAHVLDLAGEMANMVCGDWLTRACHRRRFDLRPPLVVPLPPGWNPERWGLPGAPDGAVMCVNDVPVCLRLSFVEQPV